MPNDAEREELEKLAAVLHQAWHVAQRKRPGWTAAKWHDLSDEDRLVWMDTARTICHEGLMCCPRCNHSGHHPAERAAGKPPH